MPRRHGDYESVHAAILSVAAALFSQQGIRGTSLADIAQTTKLSKGTLYYYYPAKEQLVSDIADYHLGQMTEIILSWASNIKRGSNPKLELWQLLELLCEDESVTKLHIALYADAALGNTMLRDKFDAKYKEWMVLFDVGALRMSNPEFDRAMLSKQFFMTMDGRMLQASIGITPVDSEKAIESLVN